MKISKRIKRKYRDLGIVVMLACYIAVMYTLYAALTPPHDVIISANQFYEYWFELILFTLAAPAVVYALYSDVSPP
jgi:uncharacterized membrane protein YqaE (UPF0057 family)